MEDQWLYIDNNTGQQRGPIPCSILKRLLRRKIVSNEVYIWKNTMTEWKKISEIDPFKEYVFALNTNWYIKQNNEKQGPIDTMKLVNQFIDGEIDGLTMVWSEHINEWKELGSVQELRQFLQEANEEEDRESRIFEVQDAISSNDQVFQGESKEAMTTYAAEDGKEYVYDAETKKWMTPNEKIHEELEALCNRENEKNENHDEKDEIDSKENLKRKIEDNDNEKEKEEKENEEKTINKKQKKKKKKNKNKWKTKNSKTWIYFNGLPLDITIEEVEKHFSKCGIIQRDIHTNQPRIKLYKSKSFDGLNGDGSICFMKEQSVELAIQLLDKAEIRQGWPLDVTQAIFTQHGDSYVAKKQRVNQTAKVQLIEQQKMLSWDEGDEEEGLRIVAIKNMFNPSEFQDPMFGEELETDIAEECGKLGDIEKITIFSKHLEGVVIVKFIKPGAAVKCIELMNGRYFGGKKLECHYWDGTNYSHRESDHEEVKRQEEFGKWLEEGSSSEDEEPIQRSEGHSGRMLPDMDSDEENNQDN